MLSNKQLPWQILTAAIFSILVLPELFKVNMFMDGVLYATVSKNLALGIGTFWQPIYNAFGIGGSPYFLEHPPLVFGIQSLAFKVLGSGFATERIYSLIISFLTILLIIKTWNELTVNSSKLKPINWLPVMLWIVMPVSSWAIINNVHEGTMGVFTLASILFLLKSNKHNGTKGFFLATLAGIMLFLASFSKGVPGLFPIATPAILWLFIGQITLRKAIWQTALLLAIPITIYSLLLLNPVANESLSFYLEHRLLGRISSSPTATNRFYTMQTLIAEIAVPFAIALIVFIVAKIKKSSTKPHKTTRTRILAMLLIGLSASLPLMATMVQKRFYFAAALPYFGIAFALWAAPYVAQFIEKSKTSSVKYQIGLTITASLLLLSLVYSGIQYGQKGKHENRLNDIEKISQFVPDNSIINMGNKLRNDWGLQCYTCRYHNISLRLSKKKHYHFLLTLKNELPDEPENYTKIDAKTTLFSLYRYTN